MFVVKNGNHTFTLEQEYFYLPCHEWIRIEGETATVGLTDIAQQQLGEISIVELMPHILLGEKITQVTLEQGFIISPPIPDISVEGQKTVLNLYPPLSGTIIAINEDLIEDPEMINRDPYHQGWLFKIQHHDLSNEQENLLTMEEYLAYLTQEDSYSKS